MMKFFTYSILTVLLLGGCGNETINNSSLNEEPSLSQFSQDNDDITKVADFKSDEEIADEMKRSRTINDTKSKEELEDEMHHTYNTKDVKPPEELKDETSPTLHITEE